MRTKLPCKPLFSVGDLLQSADEWASESRAEKTDEVLRVEWKGADWFAYRKGRGGQEDTTAGWDYLIRCNCSGCKQKRKDTGKDTALWYSKQTCWDKAVVVGNVMAPCKVNEWVE